MTREVNKKDSKAICEIYNYYIQNSIATFEEEQISEDDINVRIEKITKDSYPYLVFEIDKQILGFAYASKFHERYAYRYTCELSIYLKHDITSKGIGTMLYDELINKLKANGIKKVIACISLPNDQSVKFHERYHMKKVGHFEEVGYKFDKWIDVGYWQGEI